MKSSPMLALCLAVAGAAAVSADTIPYPNAGTEAPATTFRAATTGDVRAYFYGSTATFTEEIGLEVNGVQQGGWALENHASQFGDGYDFGPVQRGDAMTFVLHVNDTGYTLSSNAQQNPDKINHEYATPFAGETLGGVTIPAGEFIGFEDELLFFSDLNYNDEDIVFEDVSAAVAPEPGMFEMLGVGLVACGALALGKRGTT